MKYRKQFVFLAVLIILLFTIHSVSAHARYPQHKGYLHGTYNYEDDVFYSDNILELPDGYAISLSDVKDETTRAVLELTLYGNHVSYFDVIVDESVTKYHENYAFDIKLAQLIESGMSIDIDTGKITERNYQTFIYVDIAISKIGITSNPNSANFYIDGVYKGQTGSDWMYIEGISFGTHLLEMKKSGYDDYIDTIDVSFDDKGLITIELLAIEVEETPVEEYVYEEPVPEEVYAYEEPANEEVYAYDEPIDEEYVPEPPKDESVPLSIIAGAIFILLIFGMVGMIIKKSKKPTPKEKPIPTPKSDVKLEPLYNAPVKAIEEKQITPSIIEKQETKPLNTIEVKSAFSYKGATILYKIKVENSTSEPIADIKVNLYVPDVFLVSESIKSIAMLKPSESKTATFEIRPTGECGDCEVSGRVVYYDYSTKKTSEIEIPAKNLSIVCPMLHSKEISDDAWRNALSGFAKAEESTKEIGMPASTLFDITIDILQDMNLYMLKPKINDSSNLYRAVAKFYGEGVKELKYAAQIEVVGGAKKSKLILKTWAEKEEALTGFYHGLLDEIEKRVHVKGYINDSIVQNVYHYGDNIGTQVKDSFVYKSNVGNGDAGICPQCGKEKTEGELFCSECGTKF